MPTRSPKIYGYNTWDPLILCDDGEHVYAVFCVTAVRVDLGPPGPPSHKKLYEPRSGARALYVALSNRVLLCLYIEKTVLVL
jgi:hypothetical protein